MLVLTRERGQIIRIGDDISVIVVRIDSQGIQLGTIAPRSTRIVRAELARDREAYPARAKGNTRPSAITSHLMSKESQGED